MAISRTLQLAISFVALLIIFYILTPIYLRYTYQFYNRLKTYHLPSEEGWKTKMRLIFKFNAAVLVFTTGVIIFYAALIPGLGIPLSEETYLSSVLLVSSLNLAVRLSAYGYFEEPKDSLPVNDIKRGVFNAAFGVMASLWFVLFLASGLNIANGVQIWQFDFPAIHPPTALMYTGICFLGPGVLIASGEALLVGLHIPKETVDPFENPYEGVVVNCVHADEFVDEEFLVLANTRDVYISLSGWVLHDGSQQVYAFPDNFGLAANSMVTVYTTSGTDTSCSLYMNEDSSVWSGDGTEVIVYDESFEEITRHDT